MKKLILLLLLCSCALIPYINTPAPLSDAVGDYNGEQIKLGTTQAHLDSAPVIIPIRQKIVMVSIGASVQNQVSERLIVRQAELTNPQFKFVNLAQPAKDIDDWLTQDMWDVADARMLAAGLKNKHVQIVWLQEDALSITDTTFSGRIPLLKDKFLILIDTIKVHYPNVKQIFLSGRQYTGWTSDPKHTEPIGYYNGWTLKELVEDQINGLYPSIPWLCDLPYFWTYGSTPRLDGFQVYQSDFNIDGVHLSGAGKIKYGDWLHQFLLTNQVSSQYYY